MARNQGLRRGRWGPVADRPAVTTQMPVTNHADTVFTNARVVKLSAGASDAWTRQDQFVAVKDARIMGTGLQEDSGAFQGPGTRVVDCAGLTLIPGFNDAHCHLMALASSLRGVDCRPDSAASIARIVSQIGRRAEETPPDSWVRAFGYDEFYLRERRHPTRWDLDRATPAHPVRLDHRTGHASVLNSRALGILHIFRDTPDPVDGVVERDRDTGEPTGVLFEMSGHIGRAMPGRQNERGLLEGLSRANELFLSRGITSLQDASPANDLDRWRIFHGLKQEGRLSPRISMMLGAAHFDPLIESGVRPGSGDENLRAGAIKVMVTRTTGALQPDPRDLEDLVLNIHSEGYQLAFHAVEEEAVQAVADALLAAQAACPRSGARHRIEHCAECPPHVLDRVKRCGAMVATNPPFIYHSGDRYLSLVDERMLPYLYPTASLLDAGIAVAAGSDAPVTDPGPLLSIWSATARVSRSGVHVGADQAITMGAALKMHTVAGAYASFEEHEKGTIEPGKLADFVLLDLDPMATEQEAMRDARVMMTVIGGRVVWQA